MDELISRKIIPIITHYFQLLIQRNFAEAERELQRIKQERTPTKWSQGYYNALEGMLIALKSSDNRYLYINRIDHKKIDELQKRFNKLSKNLLQGDFDKGFFTAWSEYLNKIKSNKTEVKSLNEYITPS